MALRAKLELRQSQSLVMTPQLQQAIKLLQMSNIELSEYVETELERNPLLERDDGDQDAPAAPEPAADGAEDGGNPLDGPAEFDVDLGREGAEHAHLEQLDTDYDNVYSDESKAEAQVRNSQAPSDQSWSSVPTRQTSGFEHSDFNLEATLSREKTLSEHLTEQLNLSIKDPAQRLIGVHLIGMVGDTGYLTGDIAGVAEQLGADEADVLATLHQLQRFEPAGILARDLAECLALQLHECDRMDPAMAAMIDNLDLLAKRDYATLKRLCGVDEEDLYEMIAEIRELNPKPGNAFGAVVVQPVVPDVFVREGNDGAWIVELNSETLPRVLINNAYYATVHGSAKKDEDKVYISECYSNANWLVKQPRPEGADDPQGVARDRAPAGRLLRLRHPAPQAAQSQDHRRGHRNARVDGQPGHRKQIHGDAARHLRDEVFLHLGNQLGRRRRGLRGRSRASPNQRADRGRNAPAGALRRQDRRHSAPVGNRYRPAHSGQISRSDGHSLLGSTPPREARPDLIGVACPTISGETHHCNWAINMWW